MTTTELASLVKSLAPVVREQIAGAISGFAERVSALEQRPVPRDGRDGEKGERGEKGDRGADGDNGLTVTGPQGERGERGEKGDRGEPGPRGEAGPAGESVVGPQGPPGRDGADGKDADPQLVKDLQARVDALHVELAAVKALQPSFVIDDAGDLHSVVGGELRRIGRVRGADGRDGKDGLSIKGEPGKDGKDGRDGLGFDDMTLSYDGERTYTFRWTQAEHVRESGFTMPVLLDRGVWTVDAAYVKGDVVTFGGSMWIAKAESQGVKPGEAADASRAWRLAVKHGRDGRHGKDGERGPEGPQGRAGKDLTQMGPDGSKW